MTIDREDADPSVFRCSRIASAMSWSKIGIGLLFKAMGISVEG